MSTPTHVPRVRFCPAPSGWLHVGGARTALYNWLHARRRGGAFVFRVEDTDAQRATDESMRGMIDALSFLGLTWDEGPQVGGPFGPYRQSERQALYTAAADLLLASGAAYEAFETPDELREQREAAQAAGRPPGYAGGHRDLTDAQRAAFRAQGRQPVLRLRTPDTGTVEIDDEVRGTVTFDWSEIADFVIRRADGTATYVLANTVDDLAMGITLIARGEDLLSATPRQVLLISRLLAVEDGTSLLARALASAGLDGAPAPARPGYAHLPLLVGDDRKPLSKRHGSVAIDELRRQGFLPETLVNFLALCGWSYDGVTERFTVDELVERFSFDRVGRNPAAFDTDKLRSMNGDRIRDLPVAELAARLEPNLVDAGVLPAAVTADERALLAALTPLVQERIQTLAEAVDLIGFCFADEVAYDEQAVRKHLKGRAGEVLDAAAVALAEVEPWSDGAIMRALDGVAEDLGLGRGKTFQPVRVAVAGSAVSPPLPETLAVLDRATVVDRIRAARPLVAEPQQA
ncbi:MAG: glutamate--tRNA ligase [Actinobacteria bacterium]|nr:glutamate--tRNA ligase [Actinomycetota bacterium]